MTALNRGIFVMLDGTAEAVPFPRSTSPLKPKEGPFDSLRAGFEWGTRCRQELREYAVNISGTLKNFSV